MKKFISILCVGSLLAGVMFIYTQAQQKQPKQKPAATKDAAQTEKAKPAAAKGAAQAEKAKPAIDITEQAQTFNSAKYAAPPDKFNPGQAKPHALDAKALRKTKNGYIIQMPSKAPVPTPAFYKGKLYVSGGFRSREFYCLDAITGGLKWGFSLDDDGPSSAAVADGVVAYNTESCTIFVHDAETGKLLWSYWLGDPLMSSPTIANGRVFAAYPAAGRTAGSPATGKGTFGNIIPAPNVPLQQAVPQQQKQPVPKSNAKPAPPLSHVLACFELKTGKILWQRWIDSDVMSAPVATGNQLHVATFGGTIYQFNPTDGKIISAKKQRATSAPILVNNKLIFSKRTDKAGEAASEGIAKEFKNGTYRIVAPTPAVNIDIGVQKYSTLAITGKSLDAANGFSSGVPYAANVLSAMYNIGQANVSTLQAYQGARVLNWGGMNYACVGGNKMTCTSSGTGKRLWEIKLEGDLKKEGGSLAAPPATAGGRLFLSTLKGEVLEIGAKNGEILKRHKIGAPTRFQPIIAEGRIFVTTQDGKLVCFNTGDRKLTGWTQWGGNAARTGVVDEMAKE